MLKYSHGLKLNLCGINLEMVHKPKNKLWMTFKIIVEIKNASVGS